MGKQSSRTSKFAAVILISVNLITLISYILIFAVSVWIISSPGTLSSSIHNLGNAHLKALLPLDVMTVNLGVALAGISVFFIMVSFMGIFGAVTRSPFLLFMYSILVLLLLVLECALLYYFSSGLVEKGLQIQDGQWTHALRTAFRCCEYNSTTFNSEDQSLPWSCCGPEAHPDNCSLASLHTKNCQQTMTHWIDRYQTVIYTSLAVLHIIVSSCAILRRSRNVAPLYS